jgi:hypothetical protein
MKEFTKICSLLLAVMLLAAPKISLANDEQPQGSAELSNPFSDFVPFEDEYDVDEDERFMYFGRFFGLSLGSGVHRFGGNLGKLYNTALPVLDFRLLYFFDFRLALQVGFSTASHAYNAQPFGPTEVSLTRLNLDMKYYFDTKNYGAAITSANPYAILGISQTFRNQTFQGQGRVERDNAFAVNGGLGMEFALKPRKTSLGVEGRWHQIFFRDRYSDQFLQSGLPNTTGFMYSFITSVIWFF